MKPYQVLGISPDATPQQARAAYTALVKKHHPDTGGDAEQLQQVMTAYNSFIPLQHFKINIPDYPHKNRNIVIDYPLTVDQVETGIDQDINVSTPMGINRSVHIKIPPGVGNGQKIVFKGCGENAKSRLHSGDLHAIVSITKHKRFKALGLDLKCNYTITQKQAREGADLEVEGLNKVRLALKIQPGTQHNTTYRISKAGLPSLSKKHQGDLVLTIKIKR